MATKKKPTNGTEEKTNRELFVEELAERIRDVKHEEIANAIVWAIESCGGKIPNPEEVAE